LILVFVFCAILFILVFKITGWLSDLLKFNREDKITAQYCGTKKSLVHGTVFSKILFQDFVSVGLILLPLMVFHAFQIFVVSVIANKMAKNLEKK
jgi:sodium/bile acid cotransporter 7